MKKIVIIGLTGEIGAGKDTFCEHLKEVLKEPVFCFRFSDPLSRALNIFFDEIKREDQQWLGVVLRQRFGNDILAKAMKKKILSLKEGNVILNGVRYWEEVEMIKELGGKMVYITAGSKLRWQRTKKRGEKKDDSAPYNKFLEREKAKTELLIPEIGKNCDFEVENTGSFEDYYKKIDRVIEELK